MNVGCTVLVAEECRNGCRSGGYVSQGVGYMWLGWDKARGVGKGVGKGVGGVGNECKKG